MSIAIIITIITVTVFKIGSNIDGTTHLAVARKKALKDALLIVSNKHNLQRAMPQHDADLWLYSTGDTG